MNLEEKKNSKFTELKEKISSGKLESDLWKNLSLENNSDNDTEDIQETTKKAFDYALRLLSQRDYSVYKMEKKLKSRQFTSEEINLTIEKLHSFNYLREEEYTKSRIKQLILRGYANGYILHKLKEERLISEESLINEIRAAQDLSSDSQIKSIIEKKLRGKIIPKEFDLRMKLRDKTARFLISKGYHFSEIGNHLNEYFK